MVEWRDVKGYEGYYKVSSLGSIARVDRTVKDKRGYYKRIQGRVLSPGRQNSGHLGVGLCRDGVVTQLRVHRIVLESFTGACPKGKECRHLDGNPENNNISNLQWATHRENINDREAHGTLPRGETHGYSKLTEDDVRLIRCWLELGYTMGQIAEPFGVSKTTVCRINTGATWSWLDSP